jgi:hypothetical protein
MTDPTRQLLWTGGWDSTFRLLWLVRTEARQVQPIYLIDAHRQSLGQELRALATIRRELARLDPAAAARILPTRFADLADLPPDPQVGESFRRIKATYPFVGSQYHWLATYCENTGAAALELASHKETPGRVSGLTQLLRPWLVPCGNQASENWRLGPGCPDPDLQRLFGRMAFPLTNLSKLEMQEQARRQGFAEILEFTWFCHHPRGRQPCGLCSPCVQTAMEGLGRRLPPAARFRLAIRNLWRQSLGKKD